MIVGEDKAERAQLDRAADDLAGMQFASVDRTCTDNLVRDQLVRSVQKQHTHLLDERIAHRYMQILGDSGVSRKQGACLQGAPMRMHRYLSRGLQEGDDFSLFAEGRRLRFGCRGQRL